MPPHKASVWRKDRALPLTSELRICVICLVFLLSVSLLIVAIAVLAWPSLLCVARDRIGSSAVPVSARDAQPGIDSVSSLSELVDCLGLLQSAPVVAHKVEGTRYPFFISLVDLGTPEKPNRNFQRMLKGKLFRRADISGTLQSVLERLRTHRQAGPDAAVIDVGANVGMATFAAAAMGYKVIAFEAVLENIQKLCDGVHLNRVFSTVKIHHAAVSDSPGNITIHKVVGRLDNSAVSAAGANLAFKLNEVIPVSVRAVSLDSVLPMTTSVLLLKIDVQGWEYHVLKGATKLLSRHPNEAPYLIYEDDQRLLQESNSSSQEILQFLASYGYKFCSRKGGDQHCTKEPIPWVVED
eukprot:c22486_g2_i1 orf=240-1298(+)